MFTIKKSNNNALRQNTVTKQVKATSLGSNGKSKVKNPDQDDNVSTSYAMPTSMGPSSHLSSNAVSIDMEPLLTGLTPQVESAFYRLYRDIYYFDSVAGSAVDLISQVTYSSEFSLGGINNDAISQKYEEVIERLNTRTLLPEMSTDYLVLGVHCSSLLYNKQKKVFADMICHPVESLTITDIPFYSQDPIINVKFGDKVKSAVSGNSPTVNNLRELVGDSILEKIRSGSLDLDPLTTIYIPRKTFSYTEMGTSYFKRILPLYLIEKNLFRGTLVESARRQRGILHLTLGDGDEWIPQVADMEFITDLFMCLSGGNLLHTEDGLKRIDSICSREGMEKDTYKEVDFFLKGADGEMCRATKWWYRGYAPTLKVTTDYGYSVKATEDHRVYALTEKGLVWKKLKDLNFTDYLCVDTSALSPKRKPLNWGEVSLHSNDNNSKSIYLPKYMTTNLAYVIGLTLAEGNFNKDGLRISNSDKNVLNKYCSCLESFGFDAYYVKSSRQVKGSKYNINGVIGTRKQHHYGIRGTSSRLFIRYLENIGVVKKHTFKKSIPQSILESTVECQAAFLAGMIDGDGSLVAEQYKLYSCSPLMLKQVQIMLSNMGILSNIAQDYPFLTTSPYHSQLLADKIDKHLARESLRLPVKSHNCKKSGVPLTWLTAIIKDRLVEKVHGKGTVFLNDKNTPVLIPHTYIHSNQPTLSSRWIKAICNDTFNCILYTSEYNSGKYDDFLEMVKIISESAYNSLMELLNAKYTLLKIKSIKRCGKKHLYDLTISNETKPAFISNGILVHNSADSDPLGAVVATRTGVQVEEVRCLSGNSYIPTSKGILKLKSMVDHDPDSLSPGTGFNTDLLVKNSEGRFAKVDKWWYQGKKEVLELTTTSGYSIIGTKNHNLVTVKDGKFSLVKFGDVKVGKTWALIERSGTQSKATTKLPNFVDYTEYREVNKDYSFPKKITEELAYVLSLIISEGYIRKSGIYVTNADKNVLDKYEDCFERCFNTRPSRSFGSTNNFTCIKGKYYNASEVFSSYKNSRGIVSYLRTLGVLTSKELRTSKSPSYKKKIPKCILEGNKSIQLSFLSGYLDGDGCLGRGSRYLEFNYYSTSKKILKGIQIILINLGYLSILDYKNKRVTLTAAESSRLMLELTHVARRRDDPDKFVQSNKLGIPASIVVDFLKSREGVRTKVNGRMGIMFETDSGEYIHIPGGWRGLFKHQLYASSPNYEDSRSYLSYSKAEQGAYNQHLHLISKISNSMYLTILKLFERKPKFELVTTVVSKGEEHVYDLSMEASGPPTFVANGIIVKNSGGDFWKVTDFSDSILPYKLRALGISEAFLSGDANYNVADASMTIFVEMLRAYRDMLTRKFFYDRLFPLISMVNGYTVNAKGRISIREDLKKAESIADGLRRMNDGSKLLIPSVIWAKQLKPEGDSTYLDMLNSMTEKGVPVPLRVLAAAGGLNLDELLRQKDDDLDARKQIQEYTKAISKINPPPAEEGTGEAAMSAVQLRSNSGNSAVLQATKGKRPSLLSREFNSELYNVSKTGKPLPMSASAQKAKNEKIDRTIAKVMRTNNVTVRPRRTSFNTSEDSF